MKAAAIQLQGYFLVQNRPFLKAILLYLLFASVFCLFRILKKECLDS